ncbi:MAG: dihydroorotate dehydrogenase, partial [Actinomycetales bacterium]|nr:dihydroorotate dehydrogenase [Actinomycetales bacterium]
MRRPLPRVTAAAGCGGSGRELARFGDLAALDAVLVGPVGARP